MSVAVTVIRATPQITVIVAPGGPVTAVRAPEIVVVGVAGVGPQGPPGPSGSGYVHDQPTPATSWTVNHNLGLRPDVAVFTTGGVQVLADVTHISPNQTVISFLAPLAGFARLN